MDNVRVRFAPSPTGYVHVGSLRTALYNYLFARHHKGQFILRIEDTDQERFVEGAVENLLDTLNWAGLNYDEGPEKSGESAPYFQSQRLEIYNKHVRELLQQGDVYPCFCTAERLEKMREEQIAQKKTPKYDGLCRKIPMAETQKRMNSEPYVIRLKVPGKGHITVNDIIRGQVDFQNDMIDDQVLVKSDGFPTYHLANVVDDHLMGITHVIRGEEWLISTPKHILLYRYFCWPVPEFAHLPLLLNPDRSKLSKRQGDVAVEDYRRKGYLPEALLNFVVLLGWNRGDDQEIFSLDELVNDFSLERVNKSGAVFNLDKLNWMNGIYIRQISEETYVHQALEIMRTHNLDSGDQDNNIKIALAVRNSLETFGDILEKTQIFFSDVIPDYENEALEWIKKDTSKSVLTALKDEIENQAEVNLDVFKTIIGNVQQGTGVKGKDLWMPIRSALTGMTGGPELPMVIDILGKNKILRYLDKAIQK